MITIKARTPTTAMRRGLRWTTVTLPCALVGALALWTPAPAEAQVGFDRPGHDYSSFVVRSGDPAVCAGRCDHDNHCRAWSFSYPGAAGARAMCWLKSAVPVRVENGCCVSGVRGSGVPAPRGARSEFEIDRLGGDYRSFDLPATTNGEACATACEQDRRCRAWTYLRPGYGTGSARCYLKSRVTPPRRKPCCISGVVR
jgi:hypothetical protein